MSSIDDAVARALLLRERARAGDIKGIQSQINAMSISEKNDVIVALAGLAK